MLKFIFPRPPKFNTFLPNKFYKITNILNNILDEKTTDLHRWCHKKSDKYQKTCNWQKKLDDANKDNSI